MYHKKLEIAQSLNEMFDKIWSVQCSLSFQLIFKGSTALSKYEGYINWIIIKGEPI